MIVWNHIFLWSTFCIFSIWPFIYMSLYVCIYIYIYIGCIRLLNCHLCGASELQQMVMLAPFFFYTNQLGSHLWTLHIVYLLLIENQYLHWLKILSRTASFQHNIKWAWKTLCDEYKYLLVGQHWCVHVWGELQLWVCPCISCSAQYVLFILLGCEASGYNSSCFVKCCFQNLFKMACSILV